MKQNLGDLKEVSLNTFEDRHGRIIIANRKEKIGYIVQKEDMRKYSLLQNRHVFPVVMFILIGYYWSWIWAAVIGVVIYFILEIYYRGTFLISLQQIANVDFPPKATVYDRMKRIDLQALGIRTVLCYLFAVLLTINMFIEVKDWNAVFSLTDTNHALMALFSVLISIMALYMAVVCTKAFFDKKNNR